MNESTVTPLGLSDAEFLDQGPPDLDTAVPEEDASQIETTSESEDSDINDNSEAQEQTDTIASEEEVADSNEDTQKTDETSNTSDVEESLDTSKKDSTDTKEDTQDTTEFDYESAFKKVSEPFKANGVDMQVKDPNDIVKLMQMGANYQKKMAQLKPNLKLIKMLENNELLDEAKLNNLIDLSKKNPAAISKLIKESGVDPLDIDTEAPDEYKPTNYSVGEKEYNLDQVLDEIKDTPTFSRTIDILTKQWDTESKTMISDHPDIISVINGHMGNGVFDKVNTVLQQEKTLGKLSGLSDVAAYKQIAEQMAEQGDLTAPSTGSSNASSETEAKTIKANAERDKNRKAVAPVKQTTLKKDTAVKNFLNLSDEEFNKQSAAG
tara:strand:- start:1489 stop:2625 length:1137 start_codon:yes stop_codon:yes gene_type:complete